MIKLYETGAYYAGGKLIPDDENAAGALAARGLTADREAGAKKRSRGQFSRRTIPAGTWTS